MEQISRKRRSEEPAFEPQSKMHISDKIVELQDSTKMKRIHDKTIDKLFDAARSKAGPMKSGNGDTADLVPLWKQYILSGNGTVQLRSFSEFCDDNGSQAKSKCCQRLTYIRDDCCNCSLPLCEFCGYSCMECGTFLCFNCVSVFGCGTLDRPICEKCALYE